MKFDWYIKNEFWKQKLHLEIWWVYDWIDDFGLDFNVLVYCFIKSLQTLSKCNVVQCNTIQS